ncbi:MAG: ABC transporter ATP-binding protein [Planctomycetes bacterium]|nr:ABC transporter ATP-binding protein [Planctomycetota bacterium]
MADEPPIRLRGVVKSFGSGSSEVHALRGINLDISAGELFMLVGPSGCGKTTLISVVAGILRHDQGEVRLFGEDLSRMSDRCKSDFRARHVGFVFQQFNLVPTLNVQENVAITLQIGGQSRRRAMDRAAETLDQVGLGDRLGAMPSALSGGQQQRVAIARSIIHDPSILVCDEPTSALDHEKGRQVMELLRAIAIRPGRALIIVTHDNRTYKFSDRIATMEDGYIVRFVRRRFDPESVDDAPAQPAGPPAGMAAITALAAAH